MKPIEKENAASKLRMMARGKPQNRKMLADAKASALPSHLYFGKTIFSSNTFDHPI